MAVHLAQVAAVQGPILYLWDLDERANVSASLAIMGDIPADRGRLIWVSYEGQRPVRAEAASEAEMSASQRSAMLPSRRSVGNDWLRRIMWGEH